MMFVTVSDEDMNITCACRVTCCVMYVYTSLSCKFTNLCDHFGLQGSIMYVYQDISCRFARFYHIGLQGSIMSIYRDLSCRFTRVNHVDL